MNANISSLLSKAPFGDSGGLERGAGLRVAGACGCNLKDLRDVQLLHTRMTKKPGYDGLSNYSRSPSLLFS